MKLILISVLFFISALMPGNSDCDNLKLSLTITHTSEGKPNGKIEVAVEKGEAPFEAHLFAKNQNDNLLAVKFKDLKDLKPGEYLLVIQDKNKNCSYQKTVNIN